jgi:hypothetical protein
VPASISSGSVAGPFLRDFDGGGDGVSSGVETSEAESGSWTSEADSASGVEDGGGSGTGRDFRDLLAGEGRVSRTRLFRFVVLDAFGEEDSMSSASGVTSGGSTAGVGWD